MPQPVQAEAPPAREGAPGGAAALTEQPAAQEVPAPQPVVPAVLRPLALQSVPQPKQVLAAKPIAPAASKSASGTTTAATAPTVAPKPGTVATVLKPTAALASSLAKYSLPAASGISSSLNLLLPKLSGPQLGSSAAGLKAPTSRLGPQLPAGSGTTHAGLMPSAGPPKVAAPAMGAVLPAMQKQKPLPLPVLRLPAQVAQHSKQAPAVGQAGTPVPALPKHMQAAPAAQKVRSIGGIVKLLFRLAR